MGLPVDAEVKPVSSTERGGEWEEAHVGKLSHHTECNITLFSKCYISTDSDKLQIDIIISRAILNGSKQKIKHQKLKEKP